MIVWPLVLGLVGAIAEPAGEAVSLQWEAPEDCPSAAIVRHRIDALATPDTQGEVAATVVVERRDTVYVANLSVAGAEGHTQRQLEAATCDAVAEAAAVIVAVHRPSTTVAEAPTPELVPRATSNAAALDTSEADAPVQAPPTQALPRAAPVAPPTRPPSLRGAVSVEGSVAAGGLPLGIRTGAGVALLHPRVRAEVVGRHWFASDPLRGPRARVSLTAVSVRVGPVFTLGPVELVPRAVFETGAARGSGAGVTRRRTAWRPWIAAGVSPALLWTLRPRLALGITGEVLGVALRPTFEVGGVGTVFSAGGISGSGGLLAEVRFP